MPSTRAFETKMRSVDGITYLGPYQSPSDLPALYASVDVVWAAYPFSPEKRGNHLWARTNRFYESLYFKRPMILQKGTNDARVAASLGAVALAVSLESSEAAADYLTQNLSKAFLLLCRQKLSEIPEEIYQITDEYQHLTCFLLPKK